jgi:hypothetical protein
VRPRRSRSHPSRGVALAELDRRVLAVLCAHRVVRQDQLGRLFPDIPERTLRYRTRRLHELGLAGRSRPYRDRGSAPNHHWPTRRADCLMRGDPIPRGGERHTPNPVFLAHAAALTELYVAIFTTGRAAGFEGFRYEREGEARDTFNDGVHERALAPDATILLVAKDDRRFSAFVEIDLGTMSHARLRQKAELYAAYAACDAWRKRHQFLPALLFLTTTDIRARKFMRALAGALSYGPRRHGRHAFVAAGAGIAWEPHRLLSEPRLMDLDGNAGLTLLDVLNTAREPYEQACAYRQERREAEEEKRRALRDDPAAMREHLGEHRYALDSYVQTLGPLGKLTFELLVTSTERPSLEEREVLRAIARDLSDALPELRVNTLPSPGETLLSEIQLLAEHYRAKQAEQIKTLAGHHGEGPCLRRARDVLGKGGLLDPTALDRLAQNAERDAESRHEQYERREVYLEWRERAAQELARKSGPLGRLTHRAEDFYSQLDHERLRVCTNCEETIYPRAREAGSYGSSPLPRCHYCREPHGSKPYDITSIASKESEAYL